MEIVDSSNIYLLLLSKTLIDFEVEKH